MGIPVLVPGELLLFVAGNQLLTSLPALLVACVSLTVVDYLASVTLHFAARSGGNVLLRLALGRFVKGGRRPEDMMARWRRRPGRHDALIVFALRIVPGIRISGSLISGLMRFPVRRFLAGALPGSLLWTSVPLVLGFGLRRQVGVLGVPDPRFVGLAAVAAGFAVLVAGAAWWVMHSRARSNPRRSGSDLTSA